MWKDIKVVVGVQETTKSKQSTYPPPLKKMSNRRHHHHHPPVPTTAVVRPGAPVDVVLKADQPTGRTVRGVVRDVLTRGDHPRGIKVRLADGRVGRVQRMAVAPSAPSASSSSTTTPSNDSGAATVDDGLVEGMQRARIDHDHDHDDGDAGEEERRGAPYRGGNRQGSGRRGGRGGGGRFASRDEEEALPSQQIGLDAYVKQARPRRKGKGNQPAAALLENDDGEEQQQHQQAPLAPQDTVTCPVCGAFEGDEAAVSHHVASHFEEPVS